MAVGPTYRMGLGVRSSFGDAGDGGGGDLGVGSSRELTELTATEDVTEDMVDLVVCAPVGVLGAMGGGGR